MSRQQKKRHGGTAEEVEEDDPRIWSFIPDIDIDIDVLSFFMKQFVDSRHRIRPGPHWERKDQFGYWIHSSKTLSAVNIRDIKMDTKDWNAESRRNSEINYAESQTAKRRRQAGPTPDKPVPSRQESTTMDEPAGDTRTQTLPAPVGQQYQYQSQQQYQQQPRYSAAGRQNSASLVAQSPSMSGSVLNRADTLPRQGSGYSASISVTNYQYQGGQAPQRVDSMSAPPTMPAAQRQLAPMMDPGDSPNYASGPPPYGEEMDFKPSNPSTTGSSGFNQYRTAGPGDDRRHR